MKTVIKVFTALLLLSAILPSLAQETAETAWQLFTTEEGGFKVSFPGQMTEKEVIGAVKVRSLSASTHEFKVKTFAEEFTLFYVESPYPVEGSQQTAELLKTFAAFTVQQSKGKLLAQTDLADKFPGYQQEIKLEKEKVAHVRLFLIGRRVYRLTVITSSQDSAKAQAAKKFFQSFAPAPFDDSARGEVDSFLDKLNQGTLQVSGILNGKATTLPLASYPPAAKSLRASGMVEVRIIVDELGKVIVAQASSGHPALRQEALNSARKALFKPTLVNGQAVKVLGILNYNFIFR